MHENRLESMDADVQQSLKLFVVLSRASKTLMDHAQHDMKHYQLNPSEFAVMEMLYHKGSTPIQQIGGKVLLASGTMTYVIDKLVNKGYIKRRPCEQDRRVIYAELTAEGERVMTAIFPKHATAIHESMKGLTADEKQQLIQLLKMLGQSAASPD
ncbi:MarR family winged helix-turn-helix transcriptional regulator [Paenibacillus apiarius]|uniref:MarR family transcriptional regulator n=1 Tax=Paenibacillus apiarius TaxID=46240 RepID=A0ABT4DPT9_9BACL|nr:MarR family transcriptional regulator [Paenibacillus apiarius]MCY9515563.1 MarR family transcriptional regulator [Paenibacillus apiarius]MCY9519364.1 MarR family transcriptional regulator [Paenibacillus apiarius]MCY9551000.1 MarR family transcriptional regulator [Paenibacillus apiarius]MCY9558908.1 MarR family transcriptional regulator [Paenibacillus apiarius]MCY9683615.1 MarR family transcriptional regulator [Paenibacillus apiarius]